ncbi:MAG: hypothetical protein IPJ32_03945 [Sphingobacteriaceae bacterium]|nr:hypothetical protein [Sphingobacteriaceae bacterium]
MKTTIKNTLFLATALVATSFLFVRCDSGDEFENVTKNEVTIDLSGEMIQEGRIFLVVDESNPSNMYSRVDSIAQYGYNIYYTIPDSLKDCNLKLVFSGKMRETEGVTGSIAIALHGKDSIYFWGNVFGYIHVKQINTWAPFKDSVLINKTANRPTSQFLKIFPYKQTGKGYYDVDDLVVKITRE